MEQHSHHCHTKKRQLPCSSYSRPDAHFIVCLPSLAPIRRLSRARYHYGANLGTTINQAISPCRNTLYLEISGRCLWGCMWCGIILYPQQFFRQRDLSFLTLIPQNNNGALLLICTSQHNSQCAGTEGGGTGRTSSLMLCVAMIVSSNISCTIQLTKNLFEQCEGRLR
jgi:hypothetical protein